MNKPKTTCEVPVTHINGEIVPVGQDKDSNIIIRSHWNTSDLVVLVLNGGKEWTVRSDTLMAAVRRCSE